MTYDPTKAYRSARDSTTDGMADSGSAMGRITRTAEGAASGLRAATTSTVVTAGSQRSNSEQSHSTSDARVSQLAAGGDLTLIANGGSILSQGTQMSAEGNAVLLATKDIVFDVAHNTERSDSSSRGKGWGLANNTSGLPFGTNNSQSDGSGSSDTITGTQLSVGGGVRMATTEGNISLTAANIAAEKDVNIRAAGDLLVRSGQDTVSNANTSDSKAIGSVQISDTEKFSGWHREQHQDDGAQVSQVASSIGSLGGNVNLTAGGKYTQTASNVVAAKDVNITAAEIELLTADESGHYSQSDKDLKIGVFARVKSPLIDLINNVDAARQSDDRLQKMQGMAAGANAYQAASAIRGLASDGVTGSGELFRAEAGIGFKTANSSADGSSTVSRGSTIQGGGNVNLTSTTGDIHVVQGNLSAGNTLSLDSAGDILLEAGKAHVADRSKSSNAGAEVGVGVVVGAQTGVYVYAEASVGSSKANSDSNTWQNTTLTGQNISLKAEGDTTLRGATATADRIDVKTGGTLTIESLQDIAESMSKNSQVGGRVQVAFGNAWNADGYASAGKAEGSYQGVGQQSGLFAGNGGYHVDAGHVNLIGGAISSTNAANSELTAQTLTFSDLQNQMDYSASSGSISGGAGGQMKGWDAKEGTTAPRGGPGTPMTESGSDSSSTLATLTEGNITIGGKQTTAAELGINTDASAAHRALEAMPDATKLLADQQAMAGAAGTVLSTSRQISGDLASRAQAGAANAYDGFVESLEGQDLADFQALDANGKQNYVLSHSADYRNFYRSQLQWGIGGDYSRALGAVTTALIGGASGQGGSQIVGNALAPYAAQLIGEKFDTSHGSNPNAVAQALSHALLGAVLAELNGGSASVGAVAGAGGEIAAGVLMQAFPYADKETISALSQAVGALAGGAAGGDLAQIALNMGISKNAVENNRLLNVIELARIKELSNGDVVREAELTAAACALVKCSAGFAEGSVERAEWAAIEALGSTPEALDDRQWLKVQVQPGYLYTAGNGVATQEQLFDYAFTDYLFDWGSRNQAGVRAFGGLQAVGGAAQAAGGIAVSPSCASIIGCVGAGFLIASGYDNAVAGTNTLFTGKPTATWGGQAFQAAGISPDVAELLYALSQVGAASAVSIPKAGPRPSTPAPTESHAVEPPGRQVPIPRIDVTNEFLVSKSGMGTTLRYGDPDGVAGLVVNVDRSGVLGFDIRSAVDHPLYQASGTDMFASAMRRLANEGVEVNKVRGAWVGGADSVNADEYLRNVANGMSKEGAAMNTWTGRIAQKYGYKNVEKIEEVGSVTYVTFGK